MANVISIKYLSSVVVPGQSDIRFAVKIGDLILLPLEFALTYSIVRPFGEYYGGLIFECVKS